jgi:hypothetical protein
MGRKRPVDFAHVINCKLLVNLFATNRHMMIVLVIVNHLFLLDWVVGNSNVVRSCQIKYRRDLTAPDAISVPFMLPKKYPIDN